MLKNLNTGKHENGFGLGLSMAKRMVNSMKGNIWLEKSIPFEETIFIFNIPKNSIALNNQTIQEDEEEMLLKSIIDCEPIATLKPNL